MASIEEVFYSKANNNKVGTLESILSGVASGLIAIPKGFFSLGATLLDLGVDSGRAAKVEQFFDDLTEFDEKAEATAPIVTGKPFGICIRPDATPDNTDSIVPTF